MILATHAVVGAAVATLFPHSPQMGFLAAFVSHFVLDAIPHWDYLSLEFKRATDANTKFWREKPFWRDFAKISLDVFIGLIILIILAKIRGLNPRHIFIGAFFATLPDPLQFISWVFKLTPLKYHDKFQFWIHSKKEPNPWPGLLVQVVLVAIAISIF